tara:strand:- start:13127 stop:25912 length:12786 start_codon:yes stop_codon:yes gene_type:complete
MAAVRTIEFLPGFFRTDTNKKFLSATLDQLVSEPSLTKLYGYVGRKNSVNYRINDNYISELTTARSNYQLEPSVVTKDVTGNVNFVGGYQAIIDKLGYYGVDTQNHSRLFQNEYYTYNGLVDFDKFVNFSQYYWLPNGPDSVNIFSTEVPINRDFGITADYVNGGATVAGTNGTLNPTLTIARGGSYTFTSTNINTLYVQTEPGTSGRKLIQNNVSSREVLGVYNNGSTSVTFNVPEKTAQDQFVLMTRTAEVDLATDLRYSQINGKRFDELLDTYGGIDGQRNLQGKILIFLNTGSDVDNYWLTGGRFDNTDFGYDDEGFDFSQVVPAEERYGMWQINNDTLPDAIVQLSYIGPVPTNTKVLVREGTASANREYFKNTLGRFSLVPVITAIQDTLYYQDASDENIYGIIKLVDPVVLDPIDVDAILTRSQYVSPNGVEFTNGLKVKFDSNVTPAQYQNETYYVEGVGNQIQLINTNDLITPELFNTNLSAGFDVDPYDAGSFESTLNAPTDPSYIAINRASTDLNPWTRNNRWFHQDIITLTSQYNNFIPVIDQNARAQRPIIEFDTNTRLFNFGRVGKSPVTLVDTVTTDVFSNIEGQSVYVVDGVNLTPGMRIIFTADTEETVRNKIYQVSFISPTGTGTQIHLTLADDGEVAAFDNVVITTGDTYQGFSFRFDGAEWIQTQQKSSVTQEPLFDVFDLAGTSLSDTAKYPATTFAGTKIISYKRGTGTNDYVLGIPLSFRNFNNIGDIVFSNNYNTDTFTYTTGGTTVTSKVSSGVMHKIIDRDTFTRQNVWSTVPEESKQYQTFNFVYTSDTKFKVSILPKADGNVPNTIVFVNNVRLAPENYAYTTINSVVYVNITSTLVVNDKIDIYIVSDNTSPTGFYQVPTNLDNNSVNVNFETITLGQMRNHVQTAFVNSVDVTGVFPGSSNIRDINIKNNPGKILQHSAPATFASLFLTNDNLSFDHSLDLARREYTRFKNKFLEISAQLSTIDTDDINAAVELVLEEINSYKTVDMPWYASDMVAYGSDKTVISHSVTNENQTEYETSVIFDASTPSNKAVLVYFNGVQLTHLVDYTFSLDRPAIVLTDEVTRVPGDIIKIDEFNDTDGCWIPETPSKLGLYPIFAPELQVDTTFRTTQNVIRGHDGSLTIAFGDFRDAMLLELEKRIHNNIKTRYDSTRFDINSILPGKFRTNAFSISETNALLSRSFLKWVGTNRTNYTTNSFYNNSDGFTWNYSKFVDKVDGERLLGAWRGIYRYFFDTDYPNQRPWEMLGFSTRPSWWVATYGPAPYTSGNTVLWGDLEAGRISSGDRAGIDTEYTRPGLSSIIPVNEYGDLLSPHEFIVKQYQSRNTNSSFSAGDIAPVEAAWRRTSEFPYAVQMAMALTQPAKYFGLQLDTHKYQRNTELSQYLYVDNNLRITQDDIKINGETYDSVVYRTSGYINWVADYNRKLGINADAAVGEVIRNFSVQLSYKMAGFSDKKMLKIFAEQASPTSTNDSIMVPDEDYALALNKSVPIDRLVYSAVIVTRTSNGYTVEGYDFDNPFFTIIPSDVNGRVSTINVAGTKAFAYESYLKQKVTVPYGYEFYNKQQVVDFLLSYERFLKAQGFRFNDRSSELNTQKNWMLSSKEFLTWSEQGWSPGNIIVLSPVTSSLTVETTNAIIDQINTGATSSKILNINFTTLPSKAFSVSREGDFTKIDLTNDLLGFIDLATVQYEHVAVFNNTTVFNDIIYQPALGNRQSRLKIIGTKTANWDGTLNAPGYILNQTDVPLWQSGIDYKKADLVEYKGELFVASANISAKDNFDYADWKVSDFDKIKQGLLPNFATQAKRLEDAYSLDNINLESDLDIFSKGLIGFRQRSYLNDIGMDDTSQVKFYQGYIKEKGTRSAIEKLTTATLDRLSSNISFYEDWAFRVGEYGSLDNTQVVEVTLNEAQFASSPSFFTLLNNEDVRPIDRIGVKLSELYQRPRYFNPDLFLAKTAGKDYNVEMKTAGPVRMDDTDVRIFDLNNYETLSASIATIGATSTIWTANDFSKQWNVFRVDQTNTAVIGIYNATDGYILMETADTHSLVEDDVILLKNVSTVFDGFYKVASVPALNSIVVTFTGTSLVGFEVATDLTGYILKLTSMKFQYATDIADSVSQVSWRDGDKAWVTDTDGNESWAVYEKTRPYAQTEYLREASPTANGEFGASIAKSLDGTLVLVGKPADVAGEVIAYQLVGDNFVELATITAPGGASGFGNRIAIGTGPYVAIAASATNSNRGAVYIYTFDGSSFSLSQTITKAGAGVGDAFGTGLAISAATDNWIYVGAPGSNQVFAYGFEVDTNTYDLVGTMTAADSAAGDSFGFALDSSMDGTEIIIGAPYHDLTADGSTVVTDGGTVYVFDRTVEAFVADGSTTVYTTVRNLQSVSRVTVDAVGVNPADYTITGTNEVTFDVAPAVSSVVRIETNEFILHEKVHPNNAEASNNFGYAVALCTNNLSLYIGAPNDSNELEDVRAAGEVYRYVNQGRIFGTITGIVTNPTVTAGHSIRIDDFEIALSGTTLSSVVDDINNFGIIGVTAQVVDSKLVINSRSDRTFAKLRILPGVGTAITDLGLNIFPLQQVIENPDPTEHASFGEVLDVSDNANQVAVGCPSADTVIVMEFDSATSTTMFDNKSTTMNTVVKSAGSVYIYEFFSTPIDSVENPAKMILAQRLVSDEISNGDRFGASLVFSSSNVLVGMPGDDTSISEGGQIAVFKNSTPAWNILRAKGALVDVSAINRVFLYNTVTGEKLTNLDLLDPAKGKILNIAAQDIDFISDIDPAYYTNGTSQVLANNNWNDEYIGKIWWDTAKSVWLDYEQGDFAYRSAHWAQLFPGAEVKVYQWIESDVPPSEYTNRYSNGVPKDSINFTQRTTTNTVTGGQQSKYYFWITDTTEVTSGHRLTTGSLEQAIVDPEQFGVPYATIISQSTVGMWNIENYLIDTDVVIRIGYDVNKNDDIVHSEYSLIQEGNPASTIPRKIINKIIDSLCGTDKAGNTVPDPALPDSEKYGVSKRPRQSMFMDQQAAMKLVIETTNSYFMSVPALDSIPLNSDFYYSEPAPSVLSGGYSEVISDSSMLDYIDIGTKSAGYKVLAQYDSVTNGWVIYQKATSEATAWTVASQQAYNVQNYWTAADWYASGYTNISRFNHVVKSEYDIAELILTPDEIIKVTDSGNGTFVLFKVEADLTLTLIGRQNATLQLASTLWSNTPAIEARALLNALVSVYTGTSEINYILFVIIRYALSEQKYLDWAFKTSFITVLHKIRKLEQYANYQKDNQTFVQDYIEEVKPYRTKIREYLLNYEGNDYWTGDVTDFDLPGYYDVDFLRYRSPSGEQTKDPELLQLPEYSQWNQNHTLYVSSIVVENGGTGYDIAPQVVITGVTGSGAAAVAQVSNGTVRRITVTNPGSGYTTTPIITLTGGNGTGASASTRMANDTTRKISTTIKFDRITYTSDITEWTASTAYIAGDVITYAGEVYSVVNGFTSSTAFDAANLVVVADESFDNANDRTLAFYQPNTGMTGKDLSQLFAGIEYPGVTVVGGLPITGWEPVTDYQRNSLVAHTDINGKLNIYKVLADFTSGATFGSGNLEIATVPGLDGKQQLPDSTYDSLIRSTFTDLALGTRASDINIDGGEFVDTFSSHAPEELVPGIVFDALDLKVFTLSPATSQQSAGTSIYIHSFLGDNSTVEFDVSVVGEHRDHVIVYTAQQGYKVENVDYTYDRKTTLLTFAVAPILHDEIYVYLFTDAHVAEAHSEILNADGSTTVFYADNTPFGIVSDSFVTINGAKTADYVLASSGTGTSITFVTAPAAADHVHMYLFANTGGQQAYSEFYTQLVTAPSSSVYPVDYTIDLDRELKYSGPFSGNIFVEINNVRLRPANNRYYIGDGSTVDFFIPTTVDIDPDTISDNDISIFLNGVLQQQFIAYDVVPSDGSSLRSIQFFTAPLADDEVVVSLQTGAEFRMNSSQQLLINETVDIPANAVIKVVSFSNHDMLKLNTQVFIGSTSEQIISEPGFDEGGFDSIAFDGEAISIVNRPVYTIQRPVGNTNYVWATVNGVKMLPNYDFTMRDPLTVQFGNHLAISGTDTVVITTFTENTAVLPVGFRIFQNMLGEIEYLRISDSNTVRLTQDLNITDTLIYVTDASVLPIPSTELAVPGVVFIDGERITYYERNTDTNTLGRIRRATSGTSAKTVHTAGSLVSDASVSQIIPGDAHNKIWLDTGVSTASSGVGLSLSNTMQSNFLKAKPSYLPG